MNDFVSFNNTVSRYIMRNILSDSTLLSTLCSVEIFDKHQHPTSHRRIECISLSSGSPRDGTAFAPPTPGSSLISCRRIICTAVEACRIECLRFSQFNFPHPTYIHTHMSCPTPRTSVSSDRQTEKKWVISQQHI